MIQEYIKIERPKVRAIIFTGYNLQECKDFLSGAVIDCGDNYIKFVRYHSVNSRYVTTTAFKGYYIVYDPSNFATLDAMTAEKFESTYEPIKTKPIPPPPPKDSNAGGKTWK